MKPKISIVIPVYNVELYLRECLDSICAQTFTDWECICVDDGSTDMSPVILDEYASEDSRFRIVKREHSNAGACRNAGLDLAQGEYLSFLDSDDVFAPKMLEILIRTIEKGCADIAICHEFGFLDGESFSSRFTTNFKTVSTYHNPVNIFQKWVGWAWDKLFKHELVLSKNIRFQECASYNDMAFVYSMLSIANSISEVDCKLIGHRKHNSSISSSVGKRIPHLSSEAMAFYYDQMLRLGIFPGNTETLRNFANYVLSFSIGRMINVSSFNEFGEIFTSFQQLCKKIGFCGFPQKWFELDNDFYDWYLRTQNTSDTYVALHEMTTILLMTRNALKEKMGGRAYKMAEMFVVMYRLIKKPIRALKRLISKRI